MFQTTNQICICKSSHASVVLCPEMLHLNQFTMVFGTGYSRRWLQRRDPRRWPTRAFRALTVELAGAFPRETKPRDQLIGSLIGLEKCQEKTHDLHGKIWLFPVKMFPYISQPIVQSFNARFLSQRSPGRYGFQDEKFSKDLDDEYSATMT